MSVEQHKGNMGVVGSYLLTLAVITDTIFPVLISFGVPILNYIKRINIKIPCITSLPCYDAA